MKSFEQLLFYEFTPATDQDTFKRGGAQIFSLPHNRTSAQHLVLTTKSVGIVLQNIKDSPYFRNGALSTGEWTYSAIACLIEFRQKCPILN
jgi:hypothetical protein